MLLTNVRLTNGSYQHRWNSNQCQDSDDAGTGRGRNLTFVPNRNIMVVSNLSRGDMRVLIDIPFMPDGFG